MKKIIIFLICAVTLFCFSASGCMIKDGQVDQKKLREDVTVSVGCCGESVVIKLNFKHRWLSHEASVRLITDKNSGELFSLIKDNEYVIEETDNALMFYVTDLPYPAYASLYCLGEYNGKYKKGKVEGKYEYEFTPENYHTVYLNSTTAEYNFPDHYIKEYIRNNDESLRYSVSCTFEQLVDYYKRMGEYFISAENNEIFIYGLDRAYREGDVKEYLKPLKITYDKGIVSVEITELQV